MPSPRRPGSVRIVGHARSKSLTSPPQLRFYSTHLQNASGSANSVDHAPSGHSTQNGTLETGFGKASCVQQMWFRGQMVNNRLSKGAQIMHFIVYARTNRTEELSRNIAAMLDDDHGHIANDSMTANDSSPNMSLLVGEIIHAAQDPVDHEMQINNIRLSNVCSPRTILSGRTKLSPTELRGKKVVVAIANNLSLRHSRGIFSEGVLMCDASGNLLAPAQTTRIGGKVKLVGNGQVLNHLQFNENGFVNFCHGTLSSEEGLIIIKD